MKIEVKNLQDFVPFSITISFATEFEAHTFYDDLYWIEKEAVTGKEQSNITDELIKILKTKIKTPIPKVS